MSTRPRPPVAPRIAVRGERSTRAGEIPYGTGRRSLLEETVTFTIPATPALAGLVGETPAAGGFASRSEVIRAALRVYRRQESRSESSGEATEAGIENVRVLLRERERPCDGETCLGFVVDADLERPDPVLGELRNRIGELIGRPVLIGEQDPPGPPSRLGRTPALPLAEGGRPNRGRRVW